MNRLGLFSPPHLTHQGASSDSERDDNCLFSLLANYFTSQSTREALLLTMSYFGFAPRCKRRFFLCAIPTHSLTLPNNFFGGVCGGGGAGVKQNTERMGTKTSIKNENNFERALLTISTELEEFI
jgi:hypothetical protein